MDIHRFKELHDRLTRRFGTSATINGREVDDLIIEDGKLYATFDDGTRTEIVEGH